VSGNDMLLYCLPSRQHHVRSTMVEPGLRELPFSFEKRCACVLYRQDADSSRVAKSKASR